jgi:hypothetical protein
MRPWLASSRRCHNGASQCRIRRAATIKLRHDRTFVGDEAVFMAGSDDEWIEATIFLRGPLRTRGGRYV